MARYDYECPKCGLVGELCHSMDSAPKVICECSAEMRKVILKAPGTVIPPMHQSGGTEFSRKMQYYGVKDITTGEGITKDMDVSDPPGLQATNFLRHDPRRGHDQHVHSVDVKNKT